MAGYKFCSLAFIMTDASYCDSLAMNMELLNEVIAFVAEYWDQPNPAQNQHTLALTGPQPCHKRDFSFSGSQQSPSDATHF